MSLNGKNFRVVEVDEFEVVVDILPLVCILYRYSGTEFLLAKILSEFVMHFLFLLFHVLKIDSVTKRSYNEFKAAEDLDVGCKVISPEFFSTIQCKTP
jgi:hypothetical protein